MKNGLHSITAFWNNDRVDGIGIKLAGDPEHLSKVYDALVAYDDDRSDVELLGQLGELARRRGRLTTDEDHIAVMVINLLEKRGAIVGDNFNGLQIVAVEDGKIFVSHHSV